MDPRALRYLFYKGNYYKTGVGYFPENFRLEFVVINSFPEKINKLIIHESNGIVEHPYITKEEYEEAFKQYNFDQTIIEILEE